MIRIGGNNVGQGSPCFIIAEAGVNHNGSLKRALKMVDEARGAGADAVKFQTFKTESLAARDAGLVDYQKGRASGAKSQFDMLKALELGADDFAKIKERCAKAGVVFLSTPFDVESVAVLKKIGVPAIKIGSGDLDNFPLLKAAAKTRKPVIFSTGMADLKQAEAASKWLELCGCNRQAVLHCVTSYPAPDESANLAAMDGLRKKLQIPVGFSDHTLGAPIALAAVARGANILEKHVTPDRGLEGPDHAASIEFEDFAVLVRDVRRIEVAIGDGVKKPTAAEKEISKAVRRSLAFAKDLPAGARLRESDLVCLRTGETGGESPSNMLSFIGKVIKTSAKQNQILKKGMF